MTHITDLALARRLERCEGRANTEFVRARARLEPASGATSTIIGDAFAMFDGVGSPITQTFGLGLHSAPKDATLAALEDFFGSRGADTCHETSPLADSSLPAVLQARGYRVIEYSTVLHAPMAMLAADAAPGSITARPIRVEEVERWADTSALGWGETPELAEFIRGFGRIGAQAAGSTAFIAEQDGVAMGTGALAMHDGVALLAGASTVPAFRRRGVQAALLAARIAYARTAGCDLVMMAAAPGSTSQCNAERRGLTVGYTRVKWHRSATHGA